MGGKTEFDFCIITMSFKGARFFPSLYDNILRESVGFNVDWCIVDDFSNDNGETYSVLSNLKSTSNVKVRCIFFEENYVARISVASASSTTSAPYSLILDQDDLLAKDALKIFQKYINSHSGKSNFAGVCGRCFDENGNLIGSKKISYEYYTNEAEARHKYKIKGEMWQCTKTSLLAEYFKEFPYGWANGGVWNRIAQKYNYLYVSAVVRIYCTENAQSVSNNKKIRFIAPQQAQLAEHFRFNSKYFLCDPQDFIIKCLQYSRLAWHSKKLPNFSSIPLVIRLVIIMLIPFLGIKALKDRYDRRI